VSGEPENLVLERLRGIRAEVSDLRGEMRDIRRDSVTKAELQATRCDLRSDIAALRADVASDLIVLRSTFDAAFRNVRDQIDGVRRALVDGHSAVVGQGVLIGDPDARMRRVEQHLDLSASDAH